MRLVNSRLLLPEGTRIEPLCGGEPRGCPRSCLHLREWGSVAKYSIACRNAWSAKVLSHKSTLPTVSRSAGWPWRLPSRAPTDPYVRVPRIRLVSTWVRCRTVHRVDHQRRGQRVTLPGGFPWFAGTTKYSDSLPSVSPRFVSFAWRYHPVRLCSSLPQVRRRLGAWSFRVWQPPANGYRGGADRVSQVPGRPPCACALFLDPGRTSPPGHSRWFGTAPALANDEGSHD